MVELRAANADDIEAIATIWHQGWFDGHLGHVPSTIYEHRRLEDFRERVGARLGTTTVATIESHVVGFVTVHDDEIEQLYVAPPARGGDTAPALLRHGEASIATRSAVAWLAVVAGNARALRFYARHGWSDSGPIDNPAETRTGTVAVPSRRYEKRVTSWPGN